MRLEHLSVTPELTLAITLLVAWVMSRPVGAGLAAWRVPGIELRGT